MVRPPVSPHPLGPASGPSSSGPEYNLIQNPEILRALARLLGFRQSHTAPALAETIQPAITVTDVRDWPSTDMPATFAALHETVPDAVNVKEAIFLNPLGSGRVVRPLHFHAYMGVTTPVDTQLVYTFSKITADLSTVAQKGQKLARGVPPNFTDPLALNALVTPVGWMPAENGISGGYFWEGNIGPTTSMEIDEDFVNNFWLWPGGFISFYMLDVNVNWFGNMWWQEYPLS